MSFDLFVQSCIVLKRMTDVFKKYDDDRDGYITLSFEEFLTGEFLFCPSFPWVFFVLLSPFFRTSQQDREKRKGDNHMLFNVL